MIMCHSLLYDFIVIWSYITHFFSLSSVIKYNTWSSELRNRSDVVTGLLRPCAAAEACPIVFIISATYAVVSL